MFVKSTTLNIFMLLEIILGTESAVFEDRENAFVRDLALNENEKKALDTFKQRMAPILHNNHTKTEAYLIKWLRTANFDVKTAEQSLKKDIKWRQENNFQAIHAEDWGNFKLRFPYTVAGVNKAGQPLVIIRIGSWDLRQALVAGQRKKLERYLLKMIDEINAKLQKFQDEQRPVTRADIIAGFDGFSVTQHACLNCSSYYVTMASTMGNHFPELFDQFIIINAPSLFQNVLRIVKPALPLDLQKGVSVFGSRSEWQNYLRHYYDEYQLPFELGGLAVNDAFK